MVKSLPSTSATNKEYPNIFHHLSLQVSLQKYIKAHKNNLEDGNCNVRQNVENAST
jgi:hypothetical protein